MGIVFAKTHTGATNIGLILLEVIGSVDVAGLVAHLFFFLECGNAGEAYVSECFFFFCTLAALRMSMQELAGNCKVPACQTWPLPSFEHFQSGLEYIPKKDQYISSACVPDVVSFIL